MKLTRNKLLPFVFYIALFLLQIGCENEADNGYTGEYFSGKKQDVETNILDSLKNENRVRLSNLGIYRPGDIESYNGHLYISDIKDRKIYKIEEKSFQVVDTIGNGRGEGPGEAERVKSIDVDDGEVIIPDPRGRKIIIFSTSGDLKKDINTKSFPPTDVELVNGNKILVSTDARPSVNKFTLLDKKGNEINGFIEVKEDINLLKYNDDISATEEGFYVAGFSEPILKRFNFDGKLEFSRYTINKISTLYNYDKSKLDAEQFSYSYTSNALYSSYSVTNNGEYIYVLPVHNEDGTTRKLIDIYEYESGNYLHSYKTQGNITNLTHVGDNQVYALERINSKMFLTNYSIPHID